jgi:hypothetical protein
MNLIQEFNDISKEFLIIADIEFVEEDKIKPQNKH